MYSYLPEKCLTQKRHLINVGEWVNKVDPSSEVTTQPASSRKEVSLKASQLVCGGAGTRGMSLNPHPVFSVFSHIWWKAEIISTSVCRCQAHCGVAGPGSIFSLRVLYRPLTWWRTEITFVVFAKLWHITHLPLTLGVPLTKWKGAFRG